MQLAYIGTLLMRLLARHTATVKMAPGNLTQVRDTNTMLHRPSSEKSCCELEISA